MLHATYTIVDTLNAKMDSPLSWKTSI